MENPNCALRKKLKMHNGAKIRVRKGGKLEIGKNFGMSNGCVVTAYDHIKIGDNVMLGPNVLIYDQDHDYQAEGGVAAMKFKTAPITIGNNVWIGANTLILRGTTIGDNTVVGGRDSHQRGLPGKQRDYSKKDNGGSAAA